MPSNKKIVNLSNKRKPSQAKLYDLQADIGERGDIAAEHPVVVVQLKKHAERVRAELGDEKRKGSGQRPALFVENPQGLVKKNPKDTPPKKT